MNTELQPKARPMSSLLTMSGRGDNPPDEGQSSESDNRGGIDEPEGTRE